MSNSPERTRKRGRSQIILTAATVAALARLPWATAESQWVGGSSNWNNPNNWNPKGVPGNGEIVSISNTLGLAQTVTYDYDGPSAPEVLCVGLTRGVGGTSEILSMSTNTLQAGNEEIGNDGNGDGPSNGTFDQSGGINAVTELQIGMGTGFYNLSGDGVVNAETEVVGEAGEGTFTQSDGTNTTGPLRLGATSGSSGIYTLSGGTLSVTGVYVGLTPAFAAGGNGLLTVSNSGQLSTTGILAVWYNGRVNLDVPTTTIGTLSIAHGGIVNVNGSLLINYGASQDPISLIVSDLQSGFNGGAWNGPGINSSSVSSLNASQSALVYAVGYADGADGIVNGLSSGQIEIIPTLAGDAKLQGNVVFGDFQLLAASFGSSAGWDGGNFTYGNVVNFGDFQLLAQNFGANSSGLTSAGSTTLTAGELASLNGFAEQFGDALVARADGIGFQLVSVPEPASAGLLAAVGFGMLCRRRQAKR